MQPEMNKMYWGRSRRQFCQPVCAEEETNGYDQAGLIFS